MSFSSRRRNYMLSSHRRDGLIEWMKGMLQHSFVLDALATTAPDTFLHFEQLIEEHRTISSSSAPSTSISRSASFNNLSSGDAQSTRVQRTSKLKQIVPTVGVFHTSLPLKKAFLYYDSKYNVTNRRHVTLSFNEIRQILNLAQVMALCEPPSSALPSVPHTLSISTQATPPFHGPGMVTFDGDQTLYSDGANFESNPKLASALTLLLQNGTAVAIVTAAGYEYDVKKYTMRISGLLTYFREKGVTAEQCSNFYLFGGECNYVRA